jgi:hypothetical protein
MHEFQMQLPPPAAESLSKLTYLQNAVLYKETPSCCRHTSSQETRMLKLAFFFLSIAKKA